jgi:Na+/melibiose symporter-like transporter
MSELSSVWPFILGFFPIMMAHSLVMSHAQHLYGTVYLLDPVTLGKAWTFYSLLCAAAGPVIGSLVDSVQDKRKSLAALSLPWGLAVGLLLCPPAALVDTFGLAVVFAFALSVIGICGTAVNFAYLSIFSVRFVDSAERAGASAPKQVMSILGLLCGATVPPYLTDGWKSTEAVALGSAAVCVLFTCLSAAGMGPIKHDTKPKPKPKPNSSSSSSSYFAWLSVMSVSFVTFLLATFFLQLANGMVGASFQGFAKHNLAIQVPWQVSTLLLSFYVGGLLSSAAWSKAAKKEEPGTVWMIETVLYAGLLLLFTLGDSLGFPGSAAATLTLGLAMAGFSTLPDMVLASLADDDEAASGRGRREGLFLGIRGMTIKIASSVQGYLSGSVLKAARAQEEPGGPEHVKALQMLVIFIPFVLFLCCAAALFATRMLKKRVAVKKTKVQ